MIIARVCANCAHWKAKNRHSSASGECGRAPGWWMTHNATCEAHQFESEKMQSDRAAAAEAAGSLTDGAAAADLDSRIRAAKP